MGSRMVLGERERRLAGRAVLDKSFSTILIEDSGFGMTKNELVNNFRTIAKSGTKAFLEAMSASGVISIIGQFGVGFSSTYFVSDKFRVVSKSFEDEQYIWESAAGAERHRDGAPGGQARHEDHLLLLEDQSVFLEERRLTDLVKKLLEFIGFSIELHVGLLKEKEVTDLEEDEEDKKLKRARLVMSR